MHHYDLSYKSIFSNRLVIIDLIKYFIDEPALKSVDFDTLEKVNRSYVTQEAQAKESDLVWKVQFAGETIYLYLLIEFQSAPEHFMAVRLMTYLGLLYEDLIKSQGLKQHIPPVLPWVIYNGEKPWIAPDNSHALLHPQVPPELKVYCPFFRYHLLDINTYPLETHVENNPITNLVLPLITFEQRLKNRQEMAEFTKRLFEYLQRPENTSLGKIFAKYISTVLELRGMPDLDHGPESPQEISKMLYERIKQSDEERYFFGLQKGKIEGEQIGLQKGEQIGLFEALELLITQKFGTFSRKLKQFLQNADIPTLQKGLKVILVAKSEEDFAKHMGIIPLIE